MNIVSKKYLFVLLCLAFITSCAVELPSSVINTPAAIQAIRFEFIIAIVCICGGYACIATGIILITIGFTGSIEWVIESAGFTSRLINASPGVLLIVVGYFMTRAKQKIKITDSAKKHKSK